MEPLEQAAVFLTLMRELEEAMRAEQALVRELRLDRLRALQVRKEVLAEAYEIELRRWRTEPERSAALDPAARSALETAMRGLQATARESARRLGAARTVVEGIARALGREAAAPPAGYGPGSASAARRPTGQVVAFALDRRL